MMMMMLMPNVHDKYVLDWICNAIEIITNKHRQTDTAFGYFVCNNKWIWSQRKRVNC